MPANADVREAARRRRIERARAGKEQGHALELTLEPQVGEEMIARDHRQAQPENRAAREGKLGHGFDQTIAREDQLERIPAGRHRRGGRECHAQARIGMDDAQRPVRDSGEWLRGDETKSGEAEGFSGHHRP